MSQNPITPRAGGNASVLNVTAATVIKAAPGTLYTVIVTTAGAAGSIHDCTTTGAIATSNLVATIPAVVGIYSFTFPIGVGLVVSPGAAQVVSVAYA